MESHYRVNILLSTIPLIYEISELQMVYVHQYLNPNILEQLRNPGAAQVGMNLSDRCWLQTNALTSCLLLRQISDIAVCSAELRNFPVRSFSSGYDMTDFHANFISLYTATSTVTGTDTGHAGLQVRTMNDPVGGPPAQTSIPDEDMVEELITGLDSDVLAEVTLASKPSLFHFICAFSVFPDYMY